MSKLNDVMNAINAGMAKLGFKRDPSSRDGLQVKRFYISLGGARDRNTTKGTISSSKIAVEWTLSIRVQYPGSIPEERRELMIVEDWQKIISRFYGEHDMVFESAYTDYSHDGDISNVVFRLPDYLIKEVTNG